MLQTVWEGKNTGHITRMLNLAHAGNAEAREELLPLVYQELKMIAAQQRRRQGKPSDMLNTTAVVNEAWLRLQQHGQDYKNRYHFLAVAATAMRQLLIDEARKQLRNKRGGGAAIQVTLGEKLSVEDQAVWMVALDQALTRLGDYNPRLQEVFQLRFFVGLTEKETAKALNISESTVRRDWVKAKAMLSVAL
ncbi:MAG TPA: sigma-70 family RNA polymerase sigma factor [Thiolapillus brandeum]|uniref:Sigma-70 family RNA polymerase sigma factor n=1 Tax=Thiolapillus brandeum TaxID=1076588 RepID=A0A831W7H5_9GAMM|nr:sigma-70 family RNA polymerase sigma factor [Thiolapillus brandeum]